MEAFSHEIIIFVRNISVKLWQIPHPAALPIAPLLCEREVPLEAQDTSYFADSAKIFNFSSTFSSIISLRTDGVSRF